MIILCFFLVGCQEEVFEPVSQGKTDQKENLEAFLKAEKNRKTIKIITEGSIPQKVFDYLYRAEKAKEKLRQKLELEKIDVPRFPGALPTAYAQEDLDESTVEEFLAEIELDVELAVEEAEKGYNLDLIDATLEEVQVVLEVLINDLDEIVDLANDEEEYQIKKTNEHLDELFQNIEESIVEVLEAIKNEAFFINLDVQTNVEEFLLSGKTLKGIPLEVDREKFGEAKIDRYRAEMGDLEAELKVANIDEGERKMILERQKRNLQKALGMVWAGASPEKVWPRMRELRRDYRIMQALISEGITEIESLSASVGKTKKKRIKLIKERLKARDAFKKEIKQKIKSGDIASRDWQEVLYQHRVERQTEDNKRRYVILSRQDSRLAQKFWSYFEKYTELRDKNFEKIQKFRRAEKVFFNNLKFRIASGQITKEEALYLLQRRREKEMEESVF